MTIARPTDRSASAEPTTPPRRVGAKAYLVATTISQLCAVARYALLARLLGPEQLGMAATLVLTSQFFEAVSDNGSDRFLIQARDGDKEAVQRLVQLVFISRGVFTAACLVIFAWPIAVLSGSKALAVGFAGLALSPLIGGFLHLDLRRAQRHHDFRGEGVAMMAGETLSLLATVSAALLTHSFTAIVYGLIVRSAVIVLVSHLRASRRYSVGFSKEYAPPLAKFALPLMANGLLLFIGAQGDRVLVGGRLGLAELGHYSAVALLIYYPSAVIARYIQAMHLPRIAARRDDPAQREGAASTLAGQALLLGVAMGAGFAIVAPLAIVLLYGARFAMPLVVIGLIGVLQTARFIRLWPNTYALAVGRSDIVLSNNIARLLAFPAALGGFLLQHSLSGIVLGFALGELFALVTALVLLNRALARGWMDADRVALFALTSAALLGWLAALPHLDLLQAALWTAVTAAAAAWLAAREQNTLREAFASVRTLARARRF